MWFHSLLASWKSGRSRSRRPQPTTASPRSFHPVLEVLEDRRTPSSLSGYVRFGGSTSGVSGVTVQLLEQTGGVFTPVKATKTVEFGKTGSYSFTGLQAGVYAIEVNTICELSTVEAVNGVGTVNGQRDGDGPIAGPPGAISTEIVDISLGANQSGINYDFYLPEYYYGG